MKFSNLFYYAIGLTFITSGTIALPVYTPSGNIVPESLLKYLDCPIGDVVCKNGKKSTCLASESYKICNGGNPLILDELLSKEKIDIGDNTSQQFCKIHSQVCEMIENYNPPLTKDYIFEKDKYLTCEKDDEICKLSKSSSCRLVAKMCWGNYPKKACKELSSICDKI